MRRKATFTRIKYNFYVSLFSDLFHFSLLRFRFLQAMEIFKKGTAFRAFFKRPQKHGGHLVLCYIGLYTILQLQLVCARHHDLGKLIGSNNNDNNNKFNDNELNNLQPEQQIHQQQQNVNAQIIHNQQIDPQPILKQQPILDQKMDRMARCCRKTMASISLSYQLWSHFFHHTLVVFLSHNLDFRCSKKALNPPPTSPSFSLILNV
jgi:hypothetical protein